MNANDFSGVILKLIWRLQNCSLAPVIDSVGESESLAVSLMDYCFSGKGSYL